MASVYYGGLREANDSFATISLAFILLIFLDSTIYQGGFFAGDTKIVTLVSYGNGMQKMDIHSQIDIGDGPIPRFHVVAPQGRGVMKVGGFVHQPEDRRAYVQGEYDDMRHAAEKLLEMGRLHRGDPVFYMADGGAVAARAIADVTGGEMHALRRSEDDRGFVLRDDGKAALASASRIVLADDVMHTGAALRQATRALDGAGYQGEITVMCNRTLQKSLSAMLMGSQGKAGGMAIHFLPEKAEIYSCGTYVGRDQIKISQLMRELGAREGVTLDTLAADYERRAQGEGAAAGGEVSARDVLRVRGSSHPRLGPSGSNTTGPGGPG